MQQEFSKLAVGGMLTKLPANAKANWRSGSDDLWAQRKLNLKLNPIRNPRQCTALQSTGCELAA